MTAPNMTLLHSVTIQTSNGVTSRHDVPVTIHDHTARNHTDVVINAAPDATVTLTLSGAERIALIEALGGTVVR